MRIIPSDLVRLFCLLRYVFHLTARHAFEGAEQWAMAWSDL